MSGLAASEIKVQFGTPFAITFHALGRVRRLHQGNADDFPEQRLLVEERLVREADCIIAECPQDLADLVEIYAADTSRIRVIPCGVDLDELWPVGRIQARARLGLPHVGNIVLHLGRIVARKGIDNVIRGLARLIHDHGVEAQLVIVGGESFVPDEHLTPEIRHLRQVAGEEGIADNVRFAGCQPRDALRYWYSAADVFVTTPWYEPFGITPIEAMACGTPVIGARVGGIQFSVEDRGTGFLVPPNEPDVLGARLAELLAHPTLRDQLAHNAVRRVKDGFTWQLVAEATSEVYTRMIGTGSGVHPPRADGR
jgi:glycosyltransferase involved in cell wall biosynthesis